MSKYRTLLVGGVFMLLVGVGFIIKAPAAHADTLGSVTNYSIPTIGSDPYGITEGPDGNMWFTESAKDKIGKLTTSGTFSEYSLPTGWHMPNDIVNGPDGDLWFSITVTGYVGKITPSGTISTYALPAHSQPLGIATGPDGDLWIADTSTNAVYRMNDNGTYTTIALTNSSARPFFLVSDPVNNVMWVGERVSGNDGTITKIAMDGTKTDYSLPSGLKNMYTLTQGPDGNIYFICGGTAGHDYVDKVTSSGSFSTPTDLGSGHGLWYIRTGLDGNLWATDYTYGAIDQITTGLSVTPLATGLTNPLGLASGSDGNMWFTQYGSNQISKIGEGSITSTDADGDGLTAAQELQQGTSDLVADTSHDGLSDYVKSQWNTNRNAEFCNSSVTNCAYPDPLKKNIYVDIDWMVAPDGTSYKPSDIQLDAVQSAYIAHGINFHFDTGNFSDGKQVPYNAPIYFSSSDGNPSFLDYKYGGDGITAGFDNTNRAGIWRYVLFGYNFYEHPTTSAVSTAAGPDVFVSYGYIKDEQSGFGYSSFDTAIEGTLLHELGHTSCLTNPTDYIYTGQPAACQYDGIDASSYSQYHSVLNYLYQMQMVDYSSGQNDSGGDLNPTAVDHNDWAALDPSAFNLAGETGIEGASLPKQRSRDEQLHLHEVLAVSANQAHMKK